MIPLSEVFRVSEGHEDRNNGVDVMQDTPPDKLPMYWTGMALVEARTDIPPPRLDQDLSGRYNPPPKTPGNTSPRSLPKDRVVVLPARLERLKQRISSVGMTGKDVGDVMGRVPKYASHALNGKWSWEKSTYKALVVAVRAAERGELAWK